MIAEFNTLRAEQLTLIQQFPEVRWSEERDALWGRVILQWVVTKTYQQWLTAQVVLGGEAVERAIASVERGLQTEVAVMKAMGLLHLTRISTIF